MRDKHPQEQEGRWSVLIEDITFCNRECKRKCRRNKKNIKDFSIPHSFFVERPPDCPYNKKDNNHGIYHTRQKEGRWSEWPKCIVLILPVRFAMITGFAHRKRLDLRGWAYRRFMKEDKNTTNAGCIKKVILQNRSKKRWNRFLRKVGEANGEQERRVVQWNPDSRFHHPEAHG